MVTLKNVSKGPRMVLLGSAKYEIFQPGEQKTIRGDQVRGLPSGMVEVELAAQAGGNVPDQPAGLDAAFHPLDRDQNGELGGSKPDEPPALSEMTRAELEAQATAEGIALDQIAGSGKNGAVVMADIRNAIEAKRAAGA